MVIHDRPGRLHSNSDQPTAITDVLVATLRAMQAYVAELLRVHQEPTAPVRVAQRAPLVGGAAEQHGLQVGAD